MLSPVWVLFYVIQRHGADIILILQRWELRLREINTLFKVAQLLYY